MAYYGASTEARTRMRRIRKRLHKGEFANVYLLNDWQKYGAGKFRFKVEVKCAPEDLIDQKQRLIGSGPCYNVEGNLFRTKGIYAPGSQK